MTLADIIPELADGYRRRFAERGLACVNCEERAVRGRFHDHPDGRVEELPLCDDCDAAPAPWMPA